MRVALVYLDALEAGGYPRDARWLAGALDDAGVSVRVVSRPGLHRDGLGQATVVSPSDFASIAHESDVIHLWGFFLPDQFLMCRKLWGTGRFVISPLGHLMWPHIKRKWWKKTPYLIAMQPLLRKRRHVAHFFSDAEAEDRSRRWLGGAADFRASLGIYPAPLRVKGSADKPGDYLLFFGRNDIHQKGVDLLLQGYARAVGMGLTCPPGGRRATSREQRTGPPRDDRLSWTHACCERRRPCHRRAKMGVDIGRAVSRLP